MNKKVLVYLALLLCVLSLSACGGSSQPGATIPPGITKPDGGIVSTDPPAVQGRIVKLTEDSITLMVQNEEWEMLLDERAQYEVKRFAELDMPMVEGGFVIAYYETDEESGKHTVSRLEQLTVN